MDDSMAWGQRGTAQLVMLVVLGALSAGLITASVGKTARMSNAIVAQQQYQSLTKHMNHMLKMGIYEYFATAHLKSSAVTHNKQTINLVNSESTTTIDGKQYTTAKLTVSAKRGQGSSKKLSETLLLRRSRRLEHIPSVALTEYGPTERERLANAFFALPATALSKLAAGSRVFAKDCNQVDGSVTGLVWITGNCQLTQKHLGDTERPILLIVEDGQLIIDSATVYGLVIHLCATSANHSGTLLSGATIKGAMITLCQAPKNRSRIAYDKQILQQLLKHVDNMHISIVEGSWRRN